MTKNTLRLFSLVALISFLAFVSPAHAVHHLVFINSVIKMNDASCAVELEISGANQNGFTDTDQISFSNATIPVKVTDFADFFATINASDGNNDTGDTILAASTTFASDSGITADLGFDDSLCASLAGQTVVDFDIDESTNIDSIDLGSIDSFGDNTAVVKTSSSATPELVDLTAEALTIKNNDGTTAEVQAAADSGTTGGDSSSGTTTSSNGTAASSCVLSRSMSGSNFTSSWMTVVMGLIPLLLCRKKITALPSL